MSLYFEDVSVGQAFSVPGRTITDLDIGLFAMVSGDMHPIHTNTEYAARSEFGGKIAHGPFGIALAMGLFVRIPEFVETGIALTDIGNWIFRAPLYVGDTVRLEMTIAGKRRTRSGRGIIDRHMKLVKEDDSVPQEGTMGMLIRSRDQLFRPSAPEREA